MEPRQHPERMKKLLARRKRHGWSWPELSRRCGLPEWKLQWWRRRLEKTKPARRSERTFVPVQVIDAARRDTPPLELITVSGVRILVTDSFDADHLKRVLKALEPAC